MNQDCLKRKPQMANIKETNIVKFFSMEKTSLDSKKARQEHVRQNPKEHAVLNVLAFVTTHKVEVNKKDPSKTSIRFVGQFEVTDFLTGEVVHAGEAFFPGPAESFLHGLIAGSEGGAVRLAFQVTIAEDTKDDSLTGYKFGMKLFTNKDAQQDPFLELRESLPALQLEAPKAAAKKK